MRTFLYFGEMLEEYVEKILHRRPNLGFLGGNLDEFLKESKWTVGKILAGFVEKPSSFFFLNSGNNFCGFPPKNSVENFERSRRVSTEEFGWKVGEKIYVEETLGQFRKKTIEITLETTLVDFLRKNSVENFGRSPRVTTEEFG